ncbi:MAG: ribulose-phosphate 3-epimerase [Candidatus Microgenomates bacterium]
MITPIIMESNLDLVREKVETLRNRGEERVHIDIGDGLFSDLLSISPADLQAINLEKMKVDLHLLVDDPTEYIEECIALKPNRLIAQIERMGSQTRYLEVIRDYGVGVLGGLALKIETPIEAIEQEALHLASAIVLLEIPPGTSGSSFDMRVLPKIKELRKIYSGQIIVDGGINPETYKLATLAGADEAGANSSYWRGEFNHE